MRWNKTFAVLIAVLALAFESEGRGVMRADITVTGYEGEPPLENFPVPVRLSEETFPGFTYEACRPDGTDVSFTLPDGTELPREVETWNPGGESLVWVLLPELKQGASFRIFFSDSAMTEQPACQDDGSVWKPAGYVGVWHMAEAEGIVRDSAGNGLDATPKGELSDAVVYPDGIAGPARSNGATSKRKAYLSIPSYDHLALGGTFTFSGWYDATARERYVRPVSRKISYNDDNGWETELANNDTEIDVRGRQNGLHVKAKIPHFIDSGWLHLAFAYDDATISIYTNGWVSKSGKIKSATDNGKPLSIGCDSDGNEAFFSGYLDECRLRSSPSSPEWVRAEEASVRNRSFLTFGGVIAGATSIEIVCNPSRPLPGAVPPLGLQDGIEAGQEVPCSVPAGIIDIADGIRAACTGWKLYGFDEAAGRFVHDATRENATGTGNSFTYVHPTPPVSSQIEWQLAVSNRVTAAVQNPVFGSVDRPESWIALDDQVTITALPAEECSFYKWTGDLQGNNPMAETITLRADGPLAVEAIFRPNLYVSPEGDDANDGRSAAAPKQTLDGAIASAPGAATIRLLPGTHVVTKPVFLKGAIGLIGEGEKTILTRDGKFATNILNIAHADAFVRDLVIDGGNQKGESAVLLSQGGSVIGCVLRNTKTWNLSCSGAAIYLEDDGYVRDCVFTNNHAQTSGGGGANGGALHMDGGLVENCLFRDNRIQYGGGLWGGGGVYIGGGILRNSLIIENEVTVEGSGLVAFGGRVENCTIADNFATESTKAAGVLNKGATLVNCIIDGNWNKLGPLNYKSDGKAAVCTHSCSTPLIEGEGNVEANPQFVDRATGDYRIRAGLCVDSGASLPWQDGATDLGGLPRLSGHGVDMGCHEYEMTGLAVSLDVTPSTGLGSVDATMTANVFGDDLSGLVYTWDFADGSPVLSGTAHRRVTHRYAPGLYSPTLTVVNGAGEEASFTQRDAVRVYPKRAYVVMTNSTPAYPYDSWGKAATNIHDAVAACGDGATIVVSNGLYETSETITLIKRIALVSQNGPAVTTLRITSSENDVFYGGGEGALLAGFTVEGKDYSAVELDNGGSISNCVVRGVSTINNTCSGAGIHIKDGGSVIDCVVTGNFLRCSGGWGGKGGGILAERGVLVSGCVVTDNRISYGGISHGGGIALLGDGNILRNSLIAGNFCCNDAGGLYAEGNSLVENCTIVTNWAGTTETRDYKGNVILCSSGVTLNGQATARNLIVRGNYFSQDPLAREALCFSEKSVFRFSNLFSAGDVNGEGNFSGDPAFKDEARGDYRLKASSPCLDKGETLDWMAEATDLDGLPRVVRRAVDLGCYENNAVLSTLIMLR